MAFAGPTPLMEAYYTNLEESLTDYLAWCKMFWKDNTEEVRIENVYDLVTSQGRDMLHAGSGIYHLRWYRCQPDFPKYLMN